jgi:hypothetical protein
MIPTARPSAPPTTVEEGVPHAVKAGEYDPHVVAQKLEALDQGFGDAAQAAELREEIEKHDSEIGGGSSVGTKAAIVDLPAPLVHDVDMREGTLVWYKITTDFGEIDVDHFDVSEQNKFKRALASCLRLHQEDIALVIMPRNTRIGGITIASMVGIPEHLASNIDAKLGLQSHGTFNAIYALDDSQRGTAVNDDGSVKIMNPDGTTTVTVEAVTNADSSTTAALEDGTKITVSADGNRITTVMVDGTVTETTTNADGSSTTTTTTISAGGEVSTSTTADKGTKTTTAVGEDGSVASFRQELTEAMMASEMSQPNIDGEISGERVTDGASFDTLFGHSATPSMMQALVSTGYRPGDSSDVVPQDQAAGRAGFSGACYISAVVGAGVFVLALVVRGMGGLRFRPAHTGSTPREAGRELDMERIGMRVTSTATSDLI